MSEKKEELSNIELSVFGLCGFGFCLFVTAIAWIISNLDVINFWNLGETTYTIWGHHFSFLATPYFWYLSIVFCASWLIFTEILYWTNDVKIKENESLYGKTLHEKLNCFGIGFLVNGGVWGYILIIMTAMDKWGLARTLENLTNVLFAVIWAIIIIGIVALYIWINSLKFKRQLQNKTATSKKKKSKKED